jgi:hypothetical protein
MSVPLPIATPRSAAASAAASFTPSPTMATTCPCSCSRRTASTLPSGRTPAITASGSMPTSAATARAAGWASPVTSIGRRPRPRSSATASADGRLQPVGHVDHSAGPARPTDEHRGPGVGPVVGPAGSGQGGGHVEAAGDEPVAPADADGVPVHDALDAEAAGRAEGRRGADRRLGRGRRRRSARATGCSLPLSTAAARRSTSASTFARSGGDAGDAHLPLGDRAGLVEQDDVRAAGALEDLGAPDEDAELRAPPCADEERCRRREPQRAGARDDEHGDGGGERGRRRRNRRGASRARSRRRPRGRSARRRR